MNEQAMADVVSADPWMMAVLREAQQLHLPDWMIGSGFLRNKVWDHLHHIKREGADTKDIDLVYFDSTNVSEQSDENLSAQMNGNLGLQWEIINQAYTHLWHDHSQYSSTAEGLSHWVETATAVAVTLRDGEPVIVAPHGIFDLVTLIVRPTPSRADDLTLFYERIEQKQWLTKWPKLQVVTTGFHS